LEPVACRNLDEAEWKADQWRVGRGIPNIVFDTGAPVRIRNVQKDPRIRDLAFFEKHGLVSYLGVPLTVKGETIGVLSFYTKKEHDFTPEEIEMLSALAGQAAVAIHNSQIYEELAKSNKVKDEFLSVMSHELRTPLNVIMGYTTMIKDGILGGINPEQEQALAKVISHSRDQLTMITSILDATQIEADRVKAESHETSLAEFLDDLRAGYEIPLNNETSLHWDYPMDLPVVKTDGVKLKHVLQNLINNAIKFTVQGKVTVSARVLSGPAIFPFADPGATGNGAGETWVEVKVTDTGIGIAQEDLAFIFDKFHQVDSSETRLYGGVGIGLYIVKKFTELLGGQVEVESAPGKGSTFTVKIPCESYPLEIRSRESAAHSVQSVSN
jgi:signal transduction histidine kinase